MKLFYLIILFFPALIYAQEDKGYSLIAGAGVGIVNFSVNQPISNKWLAQSDKPYNSVSIVGGIRYSEKNTFWEAKFSYRHWWTIIGFENLNPSEDVPINGYPWPLFTSSRYDFKQLSFNPSFRSFVTKPFYILLAPEFSFHFHPYSKINRWNPQIPSMKTNEILHLFDKAPSPFLFSLSVGGGIKVNRLLIDIRYQHSINNFYRNVVYRNISNQIKTTQSMWSIECIYELRKFNSFKNLFKKI